MTTTTGQFNKSATLRRLRTASRLAKDAVGLPVSAPVEVGHRTCPVWSLTGEFTTPWSYYSDEGGDDLDFHTGLAEAATMPEVQRHGAVVHLYLQRVVSWYRGEAPEYELDSTVVVWLGTPDAEPRVLDTNGVPYEA